MKVPKRDATIRPPHLGDLDFEKNQLFDLRTDLPHSWLRLVDWCSQKWNRTTFYFFVSSGRWSALMRWSADNFFLDGQILGCFGSCFHDWWDTLGGAINFFSISGGRIGASHPGTFMCSGSSMHQGPLDLQLNPTVLPSDTLQGLALPITTSSA